MRKKIAIFLYCLFLYNPLIGNCQATKEIQLNGTWKMGYHRQYTTSVKVPGLLTDPGKINTDTVWLKRVIKLPAGSWTTASLELKGARFCPSVYINGSLVFSSAGGMAPIYKRLAHKAIRPNTQVVMEIALLPLDRMKDDDASRIPAADLWRSNVSSCLWDDVVLRLHQQSYIKSIVPKTDFTYKEAIIHYDIETNKVAGKSLAIEIADASGRVLVHKKIALTTNKGKFRIPIGQSIKPWSPEHPSLYKLSAVLKENTLTCDERSLNYGFTQFKTDGLQFKLNDTPVKLRAVSVVWHRWVRDPEAKQLAWDEKWFEQNIVKRLKDLGGNTLRFHLGLPPDKFLDLCDKYGLMVQAEWSFFHGMKASEQSLLEQWPAWFNASLKHPSVVLLHGWNETEGEKELELAFKAINEVAKIYEPVVIGHRDVIHIHKYWWSLFENLGLYYDSYTQFPLPIMADEFGGNYLDGSAEIGKYPTTASAFKRFLGKNSTAEERLYHQALSNAKIAEYWRNIGAAGFSPFCALSSPEDGNTWFSGSLKNGTPKPVWNMLSAAYAPISANLDIWDKHFTPGAKIAVQAFIFNDTEQNHMVYTKLKILDKKTGKIISESSLNTTLAAFTKIAKSINVILPLSQGQWKFQLELDPEFHKTKYPVLSEWDFETIAPIVPEYLVNTNIGIDDNEHDLASMLDKIGIKKVALTNPEANILLLSGKNFFGEKTNELIKIVEQALSKGKQVILLDAGPSLLGKEYKNDLSFLQGAPIVNNGFSTNVALPFNTEMIFNEVAEPESNIQYAEADSSLWKNLRKKATWLWNGYRGGLIVPATDMTLSGLSSDSFLKSWKARGADETLMKAGNYYSFELQGFYDFAVGADDKQAPERLRKKLRFLVDDAPALKTKIDPEAAISSHNLSAQFLKSAQSRIEEFKPLAAAGKDLVRAPVVLLKFKGMQGKLILSQLLTEGRLVEKNLNPIGYGVRYDPVAVQFVINMMDKVLRN